MHWFRLILGLLLLPAIYASGCSIVAVLLAATTNEHAPLMGLLLGVLLCLALWFIVPGLQRIYVIGHELTHALTGLCCGAKIHSMRIYAKSGSVTLSKTNMLITLSPYIFPFYTILVAILYLTVRFFFPNFRPIYGEWLWLVTTTWCFHIIFTATTLFSTLQPDTKPYGYIFSHVLILLTNLLTLSLALAIATDYPIRQWAALIYRESASIYSLCAHYIITTTHTVRNLIFAR